MNVYVVSSNKITLQWNVIATDGKQACEKVASIPLYRYFALGNWYCTEREDNLDGQVFIACLIRKANRKELK